MSNIVENKSIDLITNEKLRSLQMGQDPTFCCAYLENTFSDVNTWSSAPN